MLFDGTLTKCIFTEVNSYYFMDWKLHTVISTIISSTGDYYKMKWTLVNGPYVSLLVPVMLQA